MRWLCILLACWLGSACSEAPEDDVAVAWLDYEVYVEDVQPILATYCGNPACHGNADRAFSLYSAGNWRANATDLYLPTPLSEDELMHGFVTSCVLASEAASPEETLLLTKALGAGAKTYHGGGEIFLGTSDRSYRVILEWLQGQSDDE